MSFFFASLQCTNFFTYRNVLEKVDFIFVFCSRIVSSCGKTAEWPFGSSLTSRQVSFGSTALAIARHLAASPRKDSQRWSGLVLGGRWCCGRTCPGLVKVIFCNLLFNLHFHHYYFNHRVLQPGHRLQSTES